MKRMHVSLSVSDLDASVRFYTALFANAPTVLKSDYAKWMLDDPRLNFSLSTHGAGDGVDHLGIQVESEDELADLYARARAAAPMLEEGATTCCYAQSEKGWISDPQGVAWEAFLTTGASEVYGDDRVRAEHRPAEAAGRCCG